MTTYDFADRPVSLLAQRTGKPDQPLVSAASYLPYGPLQSLTLGNGITETHAFTQRYFPSAITLGSLLSWTYTTDKVGNISAITDALSSANNRTYGYQDDQYFLTQGNGPWGTRAWTYDRIGNRLTETRSGTTDIYTYQLVPPPGTGHSPILSSVALGAGGTKTYQYDPAGNLQQITQGTASTAFTNDDASHLAALTATSPAKGVSFRYDGRDYLTLADTTALPFLDSFETGDLCAWSAALGVPAPPTCAPLPAVHPTYSSEGLLHALQRATAPQRSYVFHFAGRPVAQMDLTGITEVWKLLTVDHLGTPIAATSTGGMVLWQGGFEPFGADWSGAGVFLRFPGQWVDGVWGTSQAALSYNVNRWYEAGMGRYTQADPLSFVDPANTYHYAFSNSLRYTDSFGLRSVPLPIRGPEVLPPIPSPQTVPPPCRLPATPPSISPALATLGGWITVAYYFLFDPSEAGGPGDTRYEPVPRRCPQCGELGDDEGGRRGPCDIQLERCLEHNWQPQWNRKLYGPKKDCRHCYEECKKHGELWPVYKCPF
ncbi:MAG TPA: RHS repeat-associated core domain-containing protein [Thermoanaerobaculia bacterium]